MPCMRVYNIICRATGSQGAVQCYLGIVVVLCPMVMSSAIEGLYRHSECCSMVTEWY